MSTQYVALDIEAGAGAAGQDEIIELAAVRFTADSVIDSWYSLVRPEHAVGLRAAVITGITDEQLEAAPRFAEISDGFRTFLGGDPLVAHSIAFDLERLARAGMALSNPALDTFELASLLLPGLSSYGLASVAEHLGVDQPGQHRALDDARVTSRVFLRLLDRASSHRPELLQQVSTALSLGASTLTLFFDAALRASQRGAFVDRTGTPVPVRSFAHSLDRGQPLRPNSTSQAIDEDDVRTAFAPGGPLSRSLGAYEERSQQLDMALTVARTLHEGGQLAVEAGTGTGKSLAYLVPAIMHSVLNKDRVVVSTNTVTLQDQLFAKDVPAVQAALDRPFRAAVVKGRSNYLCLLRWAEFRQRAELTALESRLIVKVLLWLSDDPDGDVAGMNLSPDEAALWWHICCTQETCINDACPHKQRHACYLFNARQRAEAAHVVIVNHALLLSDLATESQVLPEYHNLVIDEAHHLEDEATSQLGFQIDERSLVTTLSDISSRHEAGRGGGLSSVAKVVALRSGANGQRTLARADELDRVVERARGHAREFFVALRAVADGDRPRSERDDSGPFSRRILPTTRTQPGWAAVESTWVDVSTVLHELRGGLEQIQLDLGLLDARAVDGVDTLLLMAQSLAQQVVDLWSHLEGFIGRPYGNEVYWVSRDDENTALHSAPLHVGELLKTLLYESKRSIIMTSATLAVGGSFAYVRERLGLEAKARTKLIGSPFNYRKQALIYIPEDMPEPNQPGYQRAVERALLELTTASGGRALVLFTSHAALRATYAAIKGPLERQGIVLLGQNLDGSRRQLLNMLRTYGKTVLMGSASFWEGVDVAGPALSALAIVRLPFSVPTDPVFAARSESFESPFSDYAVPQAVLRFKQGFGRLIRTSTDRGVVLVLDRRIVSKAYGQTFLRSVPTCSLRRGGIDGIGTAVVDWVGRD